MREIDKVMAKIKSGKMPAFPPERETVKLSIRLPSRIYNVLYEMKFKKKIKSIQAAVIDALEKTL